MEEKTVRNNEKKHSLKIENISILLVIIVSILINNFVISAVIVNGASMEPTYYDRQLLLLEKFSRNFSDYERNDVVVIDVSDFEYYKDNVEKFFIIKRIIGTPGDTIYINENGDIYINGSVINEEELKLDTILDPGIASREIKLKEDEYFVLGDNRNNSLDSRSMFIGLISKNKILGKILFK